MIKYIYCHYLCHFPLLLSYTKCYVLLTKNIPTINATSVIIKF